VLNPSEQAARRILSKGIAPLADANSGVGVGDDGGGDEHCGAWWELDYEAALPEDEVTAACGVERP